MGAEAAYPLRFERDAMTNDCCARLAKRDNTALASRNRGEDFVKIALVAPAGWATDALGGLLRKLAPEAEVRPFHDWKGLLREGISPDLLLIDVDGSSAKGPALIANAVRKLAGSQIVAMGNQVDRRFAESLIAEGALTYLPHSFPEDVILGNLRLIIDHLKADRNGVAPKETASVLPEKDAGDAGTSEDFGLTRRQAEVLALMCEGKSNQAISVSLGITVGVVKLHVTAVNKALNVRSRAEAMVVASRSQGVNFRQIQRAEGGKLDLDWLLGHMTHERLSRDTVLFKIGDAADCLYYLQRGTIRLDEIQADLESGTMFGEIGIFSPNHRRTCSAICSTNADVFKLTADQVKRLYLLNPQFALYIVYLISRRLMADRARVT